MKTLRIAMIAMLVAVALVNYAKADGFQVKPAKKVVSITLDEAVRVPGLVIEMYNQIRDKFLNNNQQSYTVDVAYNGIIFRITGTYDQWVLFFRMKAKFASDYHLLEIDR